jgi:putative ubiquitin-RnfH superfamily antitoxin RatB of RatAB toxin-antitoxin module
MGNLFTNEKETKRAIKAAVDQYEIYRNHTLAKHKRGRKNRAQNQRTKLRGTS